MTGNRVLQVIDSVPHLLDSKRRRNGAKPVSSNPHLSAIKLSIINNLADRFELPADFPANLQILLGNYDWRILSALP